LGNAFGARNEVFDESVVRLWFLILTLSSTSVVSHRSRCV